MTIKSRATRDVQLSDKRPSPPYQCAKRISRDLLCGESTSYFHYGSPTCFLCEYHLDELQKTPPFHPRRVVLFKSYFLYDDYESFDWEQGPFDPRKPSEGS